MALVINDRVKVTSTSTGTGAIALGAAQTGFESFTAICSVISTVLSI